MDGQAKWYEAMFTACEKREWVRGMVLWSWGAELYQECDVDKNRNYELFAKPAESVVKKYYGGR